VLPPFDAAHYFADVRRLHTELFGNAPLRNTRSSKLADVLNVTFAEFRIPAAYVHRIVPKPV